MDQAGYDAAIEEFVTHLPSTIHNDHQQSLKQRLKYGNEYSLRKRLTEMLNRIPDNARLRIAGNVPRFVSRIVETRNYYTHYDHGSKTNALFGKDAFVASERVRILVVANLLHDLGINEDNLLNVLQRNQDFQHWMSETLPL